MVFLTCNMSGPKDQRLNPKRALCRFQFMEVLTSLALSKYVHTDMCGSPAEAIHLFVERNLSMAERDNGQEFRHTHLYNEAVDLVYRDHMSELKAVYAAFSGTSFVVVRVCVGVSCAVLGVV